MNRTFEDMLLERILFIGEEIPETLTKDTRSKFVLLGNPNDLILLVEEIKNGNITD